MNQIERNRTNVNIINLRYWYERHGEEKERIKGYFCSHMNYLAVKKMFKRIAPEVVSCFVIYFQSLYKYHML